MSTVIDLIEEKTEVNETFLDEKFPILLKINTKLWSDEEYYNFCQENKDLQIETNKEGDLIIMPPTGTETGNKNADLIISIGIWARKNKKGKVFDSNTEFTLPNGAKKSPDVSWILNERYDALTQKERDGFSPIAPDFVVELRSKTDRLIPIQEKMAEYIENGVRLGWLIDPYQKQVHIYRKNGEIEILENPKTVSGEDVLEEFELDLEEIFT
jgi:Uma2 family endonuclease